MFAYVAAFAGALALVRLVPGRWAAVLSGIGLGCVLVCVWALATKVFPEALSPDETFARLREPFGYWNAVGLMAASACCCSWWIARAVRTGLAGGGQRARMAGAGAPARLPDAVLFARRPAGVWASGSAFPCSWSCRCGCAWWDSCWRRASPPHRSWRGRSRATRCRPTRSRWSLWAVRTRATSWARCSCCWTALLLVTGLATTFFVASDPRRRERERSRGVVCWACWRWCPSCS